MTTSTTTNRVSYAGNGVTTAFNFGYLFLDDADLVVLLITDSNGSSITQVITTNYTLTGAGNDSGGTVTMGTAPASGETLVIYRNPAITQETDYIIGDAFPAETHETALDRLTLICQYLDEQLNRSVTFANSYTGSVLPVLPAPVALESIRWNAGATALENFAASGGHDAVTVTGQDFITLSGQILTIGQIEIDDISATGTASSSTYLRGDWTWAAVAGGGGSGDVTKVGTPVDDQVGVWTGDGTIEGTTGLTYDGTNFGLTGNIVLSGTVDGIDIATDVAANTSKTSNATHTGDVTGSVALTIAVDAVDEAMISATGTASSSTYLRGDWVWATISGSGDVTKVGTPVDDQVGVWTGDGTIEGTTGLTYDGTNFGVTGNVVVSGTVDGIDIATDVAANTSKTSNATHTGDVTGATALTIAAGAVDIAMLSATGTASGTTYLRGDNTWSTPAGGGGGGSFDLTNNNDNTTETLTESTATRVSITTATITKTLPALSGVTAGSAIAVSLDAVTEGTGSVTISRGSTDTIYWKGVALTSVVMRQDGDSLVLYADTTNSQWRLIHDGINGPDFVGARITSNQTISASTATKLQFNGETEDYHSAWDSSTNYRWTPLIPGIYQINVTAKVEDDGATPQFVRLMLYKNGSDYQWGIFNSWGTGEPRLHENYQTYLNGSTDYVEIYVYHQSGSATFQPADSHLEIRRVR